MFSTQLEATKYYVTTRHPVSSEADEFMVHGEQASTSTYEMRLCQSGAVIPPNVFRQTKGVESEPERKTFREIRAPTDQRP